MTGLLIAGLLAVLVIGAMWRSVVDKALLQVIAAGLMIGVAGYAWQGNPGLAGSPRAETSPEELPENVFGAMRDEMLGRFTAASTWLTIGDSYLRRGDTRSAVGIIRSGIRQNPDDAFLWTGLGNALVLHARGLMTPAADLAYARAAQLAPDHPAPRFFYGLSLAQGGRFEDAERVWHALAATDLPEGMWRTQIEGRLALIARARELGQLPAE